MSINLQKGQRIDLTKGNAGLNELLIGLGWDPVEQPKSGGGFLGGLFGGGGSKAANVDCDASVILLKNDRLASREDVVYFGNLNVLNGAVAHAGDNLTGAGEGDDEQIIVKLKSIPAEYNRLIFVVNIYDAANRNQHFGMIQNAFIRIVDNTTRQELLKYSLTDNYADQRTLITGEIYRHGNEWKFAAIGTGTQDNSIGEVVKQYT
ncbi:MAG: TerD family protein [Solibacillus sp.]